MAPTEMLERVLDHATNVMAGLTPDDYTKPTPDTEWDTKTLANHMLYELIWIPDMVGGKTVGDVGDAYDGDLIGDDPAGNWNMAADKARQAVKNCDLTATAHLSFADVPNADYIRQVSGDLFIHSWDLAAALGSDRTLDPEVAQVVYDGVKPRMDDLQSSGLFHPPLDVAGDADIQTKLLALFGRDTDWQAPAA